MNKDIMDMFVEEEFREGMKVKMSKAKERLGDWDDCTMISNNFKPTNQAKEKAMKMVSKGYGKEGNVLIDKKGLNKPLDIALQEQAKEILEIIYRRQRMSNSYRGVFKRQHFKDYLEQMKILIREKYGVKEEKDE